MLNFYDFIQVYVFTTNHHLKSMKQNFRSNLYTDGPGEKILSICKCVIALAHIGTEKYKKKRILESMKQTL